MKYVKLFLFSNLLVFFGFVGCAQLDYKNNGALPIALSDDLQKVYDSGQSLILFSYRDEVVLSEAFADWEAYLSDFRQQDGQSYFYSKVGREEFVSIVSGVTEFTLFLKKGYPVFLYDGFIVEPQVYTAVHRKFSKEPLREVDIAFMPEEIL
jgi:hypothetical protein